MKILKIAIFIYLLAVTAINSSWAVDLERIGTFSEWESAETILMHTPGEELLLGVSYPEPALFDDTFDMDQAAVEHRGYISALREKGITVYTVTEALLNSEKTALVDFARKSVKRLSSVLCGKAHRVTA